jgi:3-deoxy-7-phosphoheptulonate synthase
MFFHSTIPIPTLAEVLEKLPLELSEALFIQSYREKVARLLRGQGGFLLVLGPCSIHHVESALEYGQRIKELQKKLGDQVLVVMRAFLEKPRTLVGWKGFMTDPKRSSPPDIKDGIFEGRKLFLELLKMGVPVATEFLNPLLSLYTSDLVTWGCVGARTSASPIHRELVSSLPMPVGFKNSVDGSIEIALQGVIAARQPQATILPDREGKIHLVETAGNPHTHLVLRGGPSGPNFNPQFLDRVEQRLLEFEIEPKILIDCAHDNSRKDLEKQKENFLNVFERYSQGEKRILGANIESFIDPGKGNSPSLSATDPCLGWQETEELLLHSIN